MAGLLIGEDNVLITAVVSITTAVLVFGYLYRKVSAYATHSLPLSRTVLFCSHFAAGFLIITVPYLLTFLVTGKHFIMERICQTERQANITQKLQ